MADPRFKPLHHYVFAGLREMIAAEFSLSPHISAYEELSRDALRAALPKDRVGAFSTLYLNSMNVIESQDPRAAAGANRRFAVGHGKGLESYIRKSSQEEDAIVHMRCLPVIYSFTMWYGTTSYEQLLDFFTDWAFVRDHKRLNFDLRYLGVKFPIETVLGGDFSVPRKSSEADTGGYFVYEGTLETFGWCNHDDKRDLSRIPVVLDVDSDGAFTASDGSLTLGSRRASVGASAAAGTPATETRLDQ